MSATVFTPNPERIRSALAYLDPNDRNVWVKMAFAIKSEMGDDGFDLWAEWGEGHKRPAGEVKSTWKSAKPGGKVGLGSLIHAAKQAGWKDDSKYERPSPEMIAQRAAKAAERKGQWEAEEAAEQEAAAALAQSLWDEAQPCQSHPYLERKCVGSHGLKHGLFKTKVTDPETGEVIERESEALLVPLFDKKRKLWSVQAISAKPGGKKLLLPGSKKAGNFFAFGKPQLVNGRKVFILGEGYATCASIYEATGHMVMMCVDASNMVTVARAIRESDAQAIIVLAGDNDIWNQKADGTPHNPGRLAAEKAAQEVGGIVALPPFTAADATGTDEQGKPTGPKDFNDLSVLHGADVVEDVINAALAGAWADMAAEVDQAIVALPEPASVLAQHPFHNIADIHDMPLIDHFEWPNLSERQKPVATIPNLRYLLNHYQIHARYNVISKDIHVTHPGQRGSEDNARGKVVDTVVSLCALNGLPKMDVPSFMLHIADDRQYNPVMDFITATPWDGKSRMDDLLATVETKEGFDRGLFALLMRRWLISAVAAAAKPDGFWSKGVLVFQGDQSLGKTSWFRSLLPDDMRNLLKVDAMIDPANKDTVISAVGHWLVELGELDGTLRKADIARLKGFISQDKDQFRRPYGRTEEKFQRRTVFFASVNPENFLADDTGNGRWWTVPVVGINHEHGIDMQQLWAEVYTLFQADEKWWLSREEEAALNVSNAAHEQRDPVDELIAARYDFANPVRRRLTATEVLLEIGYHAPTKGSLNAATKVMRRHFGEANRTGKGRFFAVPHKHSYN